MSQHVKSVQEFGRQLRELAKEKLLTALVERNQAYVAASLQVGLIARYLLVNFRVREGMR